MDVNMLLPSLKNEVITGRKTLIVPDGYYIGHSGENHVPMVKILLFGFTDISSYTCYLDIAYRNGQAGSLPLIYGSDTAGEYLYAYLTRAYLIAGAVLIQIRAVSNANSDNVWKSTVCMTKIRDSVNAVNQLQPLEQAEFEAMEAAIVEAAKNASDGFKVEFTLENGVYHATKTYTEIIAAIQAKKFVRAVYGDEYYYYDEVDGFIGAENADILFKRTRVDDNIGVVQYYFRITPSDSVSQGYEQFSGSGTGSVPPEVQNAIETGGLGWTEDDETVHQIDSKYLQDALGPVHDALDGILALIGGD